MLEGKKGKYIAIIIKALKECNYLSGYRSMNELYRSMKNEFGDIGNPSGINNFLNESNKAYLKAEDVKTEIEILKAIK